MRAPEAYFLSEVRRLEYYTAKLLENRERIEDDEYRFLYKIGSKAEAYREKIETEMTFEELKLFIESVCFFSNNVRQALPPFVWEDEGDI